jgi:type II secretory pathway component PulK
MMPLWCTALPGLARLASAPPAITQLIRLTPVPPPRPAHPPARHLHQCRSAASAGAQGEAAPAADPAAAPPRRQRRRRLDEVCLEQNPQFSRNVIQSWIAQGGL